MDMKEKGADHIVNSADDFSIFLFCCLVSGYEN